MASEERLPHFQIKLWRWGGYLYLRLGQRARGWAIYRRKVSNQERGSE